MSNKRKQSDEAHKTQQNKTATIKDGEYEYTHDSCKHKKNTHTHMGSVMKKKGIKRVQTKTDFEPRRSDRQRVERRRGSEQRFHWYKLMRRTSQQIHNTSSR